MNYAKVNENKLDLVHKSIKLNNKTEHLYYFDYSKTRTNERKSRAITLDGYRVKLNLETGEYRNYTHKEVNKSIKVSKAHTITNISNLLDSNHFDYFVTFTFDPCRVDRSNEELVTEKLLMWLKYARKLFYDFKYLFVVEQHKSKNNYETAELHFHGLIGGIPIGKKGLDLTYSGKVCCSWASYKDKIASEAYFERTKHLHELKDLDGQKIYNINSWVWGFSTLSEVFDEERCASYLKKYLTKALNCKSLFKKRFYYSKNLNKPEIINEIVGTYNKPFDLEKVNITKEKHLQSEVAEYKKFNKKYNCMRYKVSNSKEDLIKEILTKSEDKTEWWQTSTEKHDIFMQTRKEVYNEYISNNSIKKNDR